MTSSEAPQKAQTSERILGIDALRGLAAILMVQQHLGIWLVDQWSYLDQLRAGWMYLNLAGGAAAPLFVTLAGASVALAATRGARGSTLVLRGLLLIVYGVALNLMVPSWFSWGSFYVLHLLGVWLLLAPMFMRLGSTWIYLLGFLILVAAVAGQTLLETPLVLNNPLMRDLSKPGGVLRLAFFEGQFPIFPWLALALGGFGAGRELSLGRRSGIVYLALGCASAGVLCRLPALFDASTPLELPWRAICRTSFFPMSSLYALLLLALSLGLLWLFLSIEKRFGEGALRWLLPFGRTSLSLLVIHVVLFREGSELLNLKGTLSPLAASGVIVAFLSLWGLLAKLWARSNFKFSLEWYLRRVP